LGRFHDLALSSASQERRNLLISDTGRGTANTAGCGWRGGSGVLAPISVPGPAPAVLFPFKILPGSSITSIKKDMQSVIFLPCMKFDALLSFSKELVRYICDPTQLNIHFEGIFDLGGKHDLVFRDFECS
jgi:hypothetical protein